MRPDADPGEADWWDTDWPDDVATPAAVGFLVPTGFEAYARVLHPAYDEQGRPVRWAEVAEACGTTLHPQAQWRRLAGHRDLDPRGEGPDPVRWPGGDPDEGRLPRAGFEALAEVLARHTATDRSLVAFWVGYGVWPTAWLDLATTRRPVRESYLFERPLDQVATLCAEASGLPAWWQSPSAWWPADHAWVTSNDTDLDSTLVGGTRALVDDLVADDRLEVLPWPVEGSLWSGADAVNR